jgi:hypothetical protein
MRTKSNDATNLQRELLEVHEQANRVWLERMKAEMELWSELATKLSAMRSVPEALGIYQKSVAQRMQMAAEDGRKLFTECQNVTQKITRAMSNGWSSPGST